VMLSMGILLLAGNSASAQTVTSKGLVSLGGNAAAASVGSVAFSSGLTFQALSDQVSEGLQQAQASEIQDTLLLTEDEVAASGYTAGYDAATNNETGYTPEGYDELVKHYVYELVCPGNESRTMASSGTPTMSVTLPEPTITPATFAGTVALATPSSNPFDYPVGTTDAQWKVTLGDQSKSCPLTVTITPYPCPASVADYDGNSYDVVHLGHYCWTGKNMQATHYSDASAIPDVMEYPQDDYPYDMVATFGRLYTWPAAARNGDVNAAGFVQGACPAGWHLPNQAESEYLMGISDHSSLMSASYWLPFGGSNITHFSVLPAGYYNAESGYYEGLLVKSYIWTTEPSGTSYIACEFGSACGTLESTPATTTCGLSIRCVLDY